SQIRMEIPREILKVRLFLQSRGGGSLKGSDKDFLVAARSNVDLAELLNSTPGVFNFRFALEDKLEEEFEKLQVYFLPRFVPLEGENKDRFVKCEEILDISHFAKEKILHEGILLTTKDLAYLPVMAGSWLFLITGPDGLKMNIFTLADSRYTKKRCPYQKKEAS
ncbi:MAG: hypothetical protein KDD22_03625, partial [Bdellovibrionales bacterium]|nr:hypothetical protein [Bdellovibrionales bacterium]